MGSVKLVIFALRVLIQPSLQIVQRQVIYAQLVIYAQPELMIKLPVSQVLTMTSKVKALVNLAQPVLIANLKVYQLLLHVMQDTIALKLVQRLHLAPKVLTTLTVGHLLLMIAQRALLLITVRLKDYWSQQVYVKMGLSAYLDLQHLHLTLQLILSARVSMAYVLKVITARKEIKYLDLAQKAPTTHTQAKLIVSPAPQGTTATALH